MKRESFGSRLGFLLVSAGCAIGIGNVWRFPYITGQNGGGYFVLFYLICLVVIGIPVLTMELGVGLACRYLLHLAVWDYSALWGNVAGLVCPLYSFYWFLLCFWVLLVLRGAENWAKRPLYRITKWATEP